MRQVGWILMGVMCLALGDGASAAGKVTTLSVSPNPVSAGQATTLSIGHAGKKCGYRIDLGNGTGLGPYSVGGAGTTLPVTYPSSGSFAIQVFGKKKGNHPKCQVLASPLTVAVQPGTPRRGGGALKKGLGFAAEKELKPSDAMKKAVKGAKKEPVNLPPGLRPKIRSVWFKEAAAIGTAAPGAIAPGGRLHVSGERFGNQKGTLVIKGKGSKFPQYPSGKISLEILKWTDEKVEGRVPKGMTGPIEVVQVEVFLRRADHAISGNKNMRFGVPVQTRKLKGTDPEVRNIYCGSTSGSDSCTPTNSTKTFRASHRNGALAGGSKGGDRWALHLDDGWVFSKLIKVEVKVTGDDGDFLKGPNPPFPVGQSSWVPTLVWEASSDDMVSYHYEVEIMRPKGLD